MWHACKKHKGASEKERRGVGRAEKGKNATRSKDEAKNFSYDQIDMAPTMRSKADNHRLVTRAVVNRLLNGKFKHLASVG